jgi:rod shape-determining protein MreC
VNLRLDKFKNKTFLSFFIFIASVFVLASIIPLLQLAPLEIAKLPLGLFNLVKREFRGLIFYHYNMVANERSTKNLEIMKQRVNNANEIYLENMRLKSLLDFKKQSEYKLVAARVIGRSPDNWSSMVIIDKGKDCSIKRGMVAITPLGLVGRVIEVTGSTAKIMLINDPNFSVSSIVQRSRQEGLVSGTLGGVLMMKYLPNEADIEVSDVVLTSGLTEMYPKGLPIGSVIEVGEEFSGLTLYALIKPAANLGNCEEVLVIIR